MGFLDKLLGRDKKPPEKSPAAPVATSEPHTHDHSHDEGEPHSHADEKADETPSA
jgi:hypothetical protein